ncbi:O-antigen polymerase [Melioribacter sp. OK-6-Me]|uniref:O-antigen polymerase n=1 Tax=unclassified Melioribacter TaxID=2627329 RepID=UPI003ED95454
MNEISLSLFILLLFTLIFSLTRKLDLLSPGRLFSVVWMLSIGVTHLKLSRLQFEWPVISWIYLLIPVFSVLAGIFTMYVIYFDKEIIPLTSIRNRLGSIQLNDKKLSQSILILFLVYAISYLAIYLYLGYVPLFTKYPNEARTKWSLFGVGLLIHLAPLILYFIVIYFVVTKKRFLKKSLLAIIFLTTLASFLFLLQRFGLFITIILSTVFIYYGTNKFNYKTFVILIIFLTGISYLILSLRAGSLILQYFHYVSQMKYSADYSVFTEPYMYISMNLENYAYATPKLEEFTYGLSSFDFLFAISGIKHWLHEYINYIDNPYLINYNYNTYGMFFVNFRDFYVFGIMILPYIFGLVSSFLYYRMRIQPNVNTITMYGVFVMVIMFSFFNPMLSWLFYIFDIIVLYITTMFIIR